MEFGIDSMFIALKLSISFENSTNDVGHTSREWISKDWMNSKWVVFCLTHCVSGLNNQKDSKRLPEEG